MVWYKVNKHSTKVCKVLVWPPGGTQRKSLYWSKYEFAAFQISALANAMDRFNGHNRSISAAHGNVFPRVPRMSRYSFR